MAEAQPASSPSSFADESSMTSKSSRSLMDLPAEIRIQILRYLLTSAYCATDKWAVSSERHTPAAFFRIIKHLLGVNVNVSSVTKHDGWYPTSQHTVPWQHAYRIYPEVLLTCKQLYAESSELLYGHNQFIAITGVPVAWRQDFLRTGEKSGWRLSDEQFSRAFLDSGSKGYRVRQPVVTFAMSKTGNESRETWVVLSQDLRMVMSSIQRRLTDEECSGVPHIMGKPNMGTLIAVDVKDVPLPGLVLSTSAQVTTRAGDLVFPWIGRWLTGVRVRGELITFDIVDEQQHTLTGILPDNLRSLQKVHYLYIAHMQLISLTRRLEELRSLVETSGPSMQAVKGLILVYQQAKDGRAGMNDEWKIVAMQGHRCAFITLMSVAAWRLSYLDVSLIDGLSHNEVVDLKRTQVIYSCLAMRTGSVAPIDLLSWRVRLSLRGAVLMHDIQEYDCADTFLVKCVRKHLRIRSADPNKRPSTHEVEKALQTSVLDAGLSASVTAKGYVRRGMKLSDFSLLCATWAQHAGYSDAPQPTLIETADYMRPAEAVWKHFRGSGNQNR